MSQSSTQQYSPFNLLVHCVWALILTVCFINPAQTQEKKRQEVIEGFTFENLTPAFKAQQGPKLVIHRAVSPYLQRGRFEPFRILAESDGFKVSYLDKPMTPEILAGTDLFVIANAYTKNYKNFSTLDAPSVYTGDEIAMLVEWVKNGGSMLILADHSPFAGGTIQLASAFGFTYMTGHVLDKNSLSTRIRTAIDFKKENNLLAEHPITMGSTGRMPITHFFGFGGQAIIPPAEATNILAIPSYFETFLGFDPHQNFHSTPRLDSGGFSQGSAVEFGNGRLVVMGETGGFTAQIIDGINGMGFEELVADENKEFVLATLRWLVNFTP